MKIKCIIALLTVLLVIWSGAAVAADDPQPYLNTNVNVETSEGVDVTITKVRVANKVTVRFTVATEGDYLVRGIEIKDSQGKPVRFEVVDQYVYTFELPRFDVTIHITAEDYGSVTRSECAKAIWELAGCPVVDYLMDYDDVSPDSDYAEAVRWATAENIMAGTGDKCFEPDSLLTREELADVIYRYAEYTGIADNLATDYTIDTIDHEFISDWAYDSVCFAVGCGIMQAENRTAGYFNPQGDIFRFEFEKVLTEFKELIENNAQTVTDNEAVSVCED